MLRQHIGSPYPDNCRVTGIDVSEPMLREAARHIDRRHNIQLFKMDAARLTFPDQSFDVVYAAHVISVVPDPLAVLSEMRRVCRVGDHIVLLNHFRSDIPFLSKVERLLWPGDAATFTGHLVASGTDPSVPSRRPS